MEPLYPHVQAKLTEASGNANAIIARVRAALRKAGVSNDRIDEFTREALSGDYDNVLRTAMKWVSVI